MTQDSLFDITRNRHKGNPESDAANRDTAPRKSGDQRRIYAWFLAKGHHTAEECSDALEMLHQTVRPPEEST